MMAVVENADGVLLTLKVVPRSSRDRVLAASAAGEIGIRLRAAPVDDKANRALRHLLATVLHVPRADVIILSGSRGRRKRVHIRGLSAREAERRLNNAAS